MSRYTVAFAAAVLLASVSRVDAQACLGRASFSTGATRVGATYLRDVYGGEVGYGTRTSWFGAAKLETYRPDVAPGVRSSWNRGSVTGGTQIALPNSRFQFCPIAGFGITSGRASSTDSEADFRGHELEIGGALGLTPPSDDSWHVSPSIGAKLVRHTTSGSSTFAGQRISYADTYNAGLVIATFGIVRRGIALTPFLQRQMNRGGGPIDWGVGASYNFGPSRP